MQLELDPKEISILQKLIELALEEINPEIHHSATSRVKGELRAEREVLKQLYTRFAQAGTTMTGRAANF